MSEQFIESSIQNGVATLTINRPEALNALNDTVLTELAAKAEALAADSQVRVFVLRGAGDKAFVAGADVKQMLTMNGSEGAYFARLGQKAMSKLGQLDQPVIAAVQGFALGGGFELALSCDMIWAAPRALFGFPEISLGLIPGFAGTQRLVRATGIQAAKDLILSTRKIKAAEALQLGAIARILSEEDFFAEVQKEAEKIARLAPRALAHAKQLIDTATDVSLDNGSRAEATAFGLTIATEDSTEGIEALLGKRTAEFQGK